MIKKKLFSLIESYLLNVKEKSEERCMSLVVSNLRSEIPLTICDENVRLLVRDKNGMGKSLDWRIIAIRNWYMLVV